MFWRRRKAAKADEAPEAAVRETSSFFDGLLDGDGVLAPEGMGRLFMYVAERNSEVRAPIWRDLLVAMWLALTQGGRFIAADDTSLLLHEDEQALYDCPAHLLKEVTERDAGEGISQPKP